MNDHHVHVVKLLDTDNDGHTYIYMFVGCVVLAINKATTKQNKVRHIT